MRHVEGSVGRRLGSVAVPEDSKQAERLRNKGHKVCITKATLQRDRKKTSVTETNGTVGLCLASVGVCCSWLQKHRRGSAKVTKSGRLCDS